MSQRSMTKVSYNSFQTLEETSKFLKSANGSSMLTAGSTDVLVHTQHRGFPDYIVSMNNVSGLEYVKLESGKLVIGALATLTDVAQSEDVKRHFPALSKACKEIGSPQIRNRGTVVGNLCNASPASDTAPALLVYGAEVVIFNERSERTVKLEDFFVGPGKTILEKGDIVKEVIVPIPENEVSDFVKVGKRKALEISIISIAIKAKVTGNKIEEIKIACGSVAPTPILIEKTASKLAGKTIMFEKDLDEALNEIDSELTPIDDIRSKASYRKRMLRVTLKRMVMNLVGGVEL